VPDATVRPARPADAEAMCAVQLRSWAGLDLDPTEVTIRWREAVAAPPSPRHRVLVALEGVDVVGFAAFGPALDEDLDPATVAELYILVVDPDRRGAGHGSRLLAASIELLRTEGVITAVSWLRAGETGFAEQTGWAADGARREVQANPPLAQVRLHTALL